MRSWRKPARLSKNGWDPLPWWRRGNPIAMTRGVVAAHNQVTALCAPSGELWARAGELPKGSVPLRKVRSLVPDYEYIQVEVVALPPYFGPIPYLTTEGGAGEAQDQ
jgi:hypothetical protein